MSWYADRGSVLFDAFRRHIVEHEECYRRPCPVAYRMWQAFILVETERFPDRGKYIPRPYPLVKAHAVDSLTPR